VPCAGPDFIVIIIIMTLTGVVKSWAAGYASVKGGEISLKAMRVVVIVIIIGVDVSRAIHIYNIIIHTSGRTEYRVGKTIMEDFVYEYRYQL